MRLATQGSTVVRQIAHPPEGFPRHADPLTAPMIRYLADSAILGGSFHKSLMAGGVHSARREKTARTYPDCRGSKAAGKQERSVMKAVRKDPMNLRQQIEHFHKEHGEILRFLKEFEDALTLAAAESEKARRAGLAQLSKMEEKLAEIREHCREEEQNLESPFQMYLDHFALEDLHTEHEVLERRNHDFCVELTAVTAPPPTENLVNLGRRLLEHLRHHIAREESLLAQIADGNTAEEKVFLRYTQPGE